MRRKRFSAAAMALWLILVWGGAAAKGEERQISGSLAHEMVSAPPFRKQQGPASRRSWWGVLYEDALLLARMDNNEEEAAEAGEAQSPETVEFVWPILTWLLSLLGL